MRFQIGSRLLSVLSQCPHRTKRDALLKRGRKPEGGITKQMLLIGAYRGLVVQSLTTTALALVSSRKVEPLPVIRLGQRVHDDGD